MDERVDARLARIAADVAPVAGVVGVVLGGSRARGTHLPTSDADLGLYYDTGLDVDGLREVAGVLDPSADVTDPGGWGPWVDGGAWLDVDGLKVDWIYRRLDRVAEQIGRALQGEFAFHQQVGHPLGFLDVSYAGELALGRILADPSGRLAVLRAQVSAFPPALGEALSRLAWEAGFCLEIAVKGAARGDVAYVAHCLSRSVLLCAHVVAARAGRWVLNEKGLVEAAARIPGAPPRFAERVAVVLAELSPEPGRLARAIAAARELVAELGSG